MYRIRWRQPLRNVLFPPAAVTDQKVCALNSYVVYSLKFLLHPLNYHKLCDFTFCVLRCTSLLPFSVNSEDKSSIEPFVGGCSLSGESFYIEEEV